MNCGTTEQEKHKVIKYADVSEKRTVSKFSVTKSGSGRWWSNQKEGKCQLHWKFWWNQANLPQCQWPNSLRISQIQTYFPPTPSLQHLNQCENLKNYYQGRNWGGCALDGGAYWLRGHTYLPCSSSPLGCPLIAKNCHLLMRTVLTLTAWPLGWPCGVNTQDPSIM